MGTSHIIVKLTVEVGKVASSHHLSFILALDSVYRMIQAKEDIRGVHLTAGGRSTESKVSGYANYTAL